MKLAASGIKGALLVFPAVVDEWAAVLVDDVTDELFPQEPFSEKGFRSGRG